MASNTVPFDYLLIVDFSTTLQENTFDFPPEIIQFSVSVLDVKNKRIREDISFNEYCKPSIEPILTDYCVRTTGVRQEDVQSALPFREVYTQFLNWLKENNFEDNFAVGCHTQDTLWRNAQYQFILMRTPLPGFFRQWFDISQQFWRVTRPWPRIRQQNYIPQMIAHYGTEREGELFDSWSNSINLARIARKMLDNEQFKVGINAHLTCWDFRREESPFINEHTTWQTNDDLFFKMQQLILPLVFKKLSAPYDMNGFGKCPYCNRDPEICTGLSHKQHPRQLFIDLRKTTRQMSSFALYLED